MDSERVTAVIVIGAIVVGLPLGLLALVFHLAQPPKDTRNSDREKYPDDLFI
jgi:hypothetical protein